MVKLSNIKLSKTNIVAVVFGLLLLYVLLSGKKMNMYFIFNTYMGRALLLLLVLLLTSINTYLGLATLLVVVYYYNYYSYYLEGFDTMESPSTTVDGTSADAATGADDSTVADTDVTGKTLPIAFSGNPSDLAGSIALALNKKSTESVSGGGIDVPVTVPPVTMPVPVAPTSTEGFALFDIFGGNSSKHDDTVHGTDYILKSDKMRRGIASASLPINQHTFNSNEEVEPFLGGSFYDSLTKFGPF